MATQLKTLIIGAGSIGERHLRCFLATGRVQVGFVEIHEALARQVAERYQGATAYRSLATALEQSWDAAVIATPAQLHIEQAKQLLNRGIHVLIEKPLSVSLEGTRELIAATKQSNCVTGVAYVHRANPILAEMRDAIRSGQFGRPVQLIATTGHHFPTARPAYASIYYAHRHTGGGAVQDAMTHIINAGEWLLGPVDKVVADIDHQLLPEITVEDTVHVLARHGRVMASYTLNQYQAPTEITVTVACEMGTVRFEAHLNRWRFMTTPDGDWTDSPPRTLERDDLFTRQANLFLDAIEQRTEPPCSLEEGQATLAVNCAILKSAETGHWCQCVKEEV